MKRQLTKANGYTRTRFVLVDNYTGTRRVYKKSDYYYIEVQGEIRNVTKFRQLFIYD